MSQGTKHFIHQRVTAVLLLVLGLWFAVSLLRIDSLTYLDVIRFVASPVNTVMLGLLAVVLSYHSYLGVQMVVDDYVHGPQLNTLSHLTSRVAHVVVAAVAVYAIWQIRAGL